MASRRLALNLSQGLRGRGLNAVAPLKRGFATPVVKNGVKTESTTLSNGLTVSLNAATGQKHGC
jgi:processing peptidase subunit beta